MWLVRWRHMTVLHAVAWLITGTMSTSHRHCMILSKSNSCSAQLISFKIELMMFDCSCGWCPKYLGDVYIPVHTVAACSRLRSADHGDVIPHARFTQFDCHSFRLCRPTIWNRLSQDLQSTDTRELFKRRLKSWLWVCIRREAHLIDIDWSRALHRDLLTYLRQRLIEQSHITNNIL